MTIKIIICEKTRGDLTGMDVIRYLHAVRKKRVYFDY